MPARLQLGYSVMTNKWIVRVEDGDTNKIFQVIFDTHEEAQEVVDNIVERYKEETGHKPEHMPNAHMN